MVNSLLGTFLNIVFDTNDVNDIDVNKYIENEHLSMTNIYTSLEFKRNVFIHSLWHYFFKTYMPSCFARTLIKSIINKPFDIQLIQFLLSRIEFSFIKQYIHFYDIDECIRHMTNVLQTLSNTTTSKEFCIRKLCCRYAYDYNMSMMKQNVFMIFVEFEKQKKKHIYIQPSYNPVSKHTLSNEFKYEGINNDMYYDYIHGIIHYDKHFLLKLMNQITINIDVDTIELEEHILIGLICLLKKECPQKRVSIFLMGTKSITYISTLRKHAYVFQISKELYSILPCISELCIVISNKEFPEIKPLCQKAQRAIYYMRALSEDDIIRNTITPYTLQYDRYITNCPCALVTTNTPLKIYRIFDFFTRNDIQTNEKQQHLKYLIGPNTKLKSDTSEYQSIQVDMYTSLSKKIEYDKIIDIYNEIPLQKMYEYSCIVQDIETNRKLFHSKMYNPILFSKGMFKKMWKDHIFHTCPSRNSSKYHNNVLLFNEFMLQYIETHLKYTNEKMADVVLEKGRYNTVIMIDSRPNPFSVLSFLTCLININISDWSGKIYTSNNAKQFYERYLEKYGIDIVVWEDLNTFEFSLDTYNTVLKDVSFWKSIGGKKALLIQEDGILLKSGVESFLDVYYIGAPWLDCAGNEYIKNYMSPGLVGNGGLSIRDIETCIKICEKYVEEKYELFFENQVEIPEDVYFVKCLTHENIDIASTRRASEFSCEQILTQNALGFHKPWMYHSKDALQAFFVNYLKKR